MGTLAIYFDDMHSPALALPLNLAATLKFDHGRGFIGFTAATGDERWQTHDILSWTFSSTRNDPPYYAPTLVNGEGAHSCNDPASCVHL